MNRNNRYLRPVSDPERSPQKLTIPPLPHHLDALIDLPWNSNANRQLDWWTWYLDQEFESVGGRS